MLIKTINNDSKIYKQYIIALKDTQISINKRSSLNKFNIRLLLSNISLI